MKIVNHLAQDRANYIPITYNQSMLPPPPPIYNCQPLAMYPQSQWNQTQHQNLQTESSIANSNQQNQQANNSPASSISNGNAVIPSRGRILTISGGNSIEYDTRNEKRNYFRRVNSISTQAPFKKTRWSHLPITFSEQDLKLKDYPQMDAMIIEANIDGWAVSKILIDGGSSADIIFTSTLDAMKIDRKLLGRA